MKKYKVVSRNDGKADSLKQILATQGFEEDDNPEFVISYGGDGTFLKSEREFPGTPKLLVRDSLICYKCVDLSLEEVLRSVRKGEFEVEEFQKLVALKSGLELKATNDVVLRNKFLNKALRFKVYLNGDLVKELIGDGVVAATSFGSTGYFKSVTGRIFKEGYGLAFNNTTTHEEPLILSCKDEVAVEVTREEGELGVDNDPLIVEVSEGERVTIKCSEEKARIITLPSQSKKFL